MMEISNPVVSVLERNFSVSVKYPDGETVLFEWKFFTDTCVNARKPLFCPVRTGMFNNKKKAD